MGLHIRHPESVKWYEEYFGKLVDCKIVKFELKHDGEHYWPTFTVVPPEGDWFEIEISQDEEGNGPGFIFGLPTSEDADG